MLQRRDVPPEAVAAQFEVAGFGNGEVGEICKGPFPPGPQVVPEQNRGRPITVEAGGYLPFCLPGFDPSKPIRVELTSPGGQTTIEEIPARDRRADEFDPLVLAENIFEWFPFPTAELGRYTGVASQDGLAASNRFRVTLPDHAVVDVEPPTGQPGTRFVIGFAGFEPGSDVPVHIYWADPDDVEVDVFELHGSRAFAGRYRYITSLQLIPDQMGRASYELATRDSDPAGGYCLVARSTAPGQDFCDAVFELVSPR